MTSASSVGTATVSGHVVRTARHLATGTVEYTREECIITLAGDHLDYVERIVLGNEDIGIDQKAGLVRHRTHTDPLVKFDHEGQSFLQIFLHDRTLAQCPADAVVHTDDAAQMWGIARSASDRAPELHSELLRGPDGRLQIAIKASAEVEVIEQRMILGRYEERRSVHANGLYTIAPGFADVFGIVISSQGMYGGAEHKHQILGRFGYPTGRTLLRDGQAYASGQTQPHLFKSAVAILDAHDRVGGRSEPWLGFDEVEVWCAPEKTSAAEAAMRSCPVAWSVRTYGRSNNADILALGPHDAPPADGRTFSYCLFGTGEDFKDRLNAAISRIENPRLLERLWLQNVEEPIAGAERFGIGWTIHSDDRTRIERAKLRELRHRAIGVTKSDIAAARAACVPLPHPRGEAGFTEAISLLSAL